MEPAIARWETCKRTCDPKAAYQKEWDARLQQRDEMIRARTPITHDQQERQVRKSKVVSAFNDCALSKCRKEVVAHGGVGSRLAGQNGCISWWFAFGLVAVGLVCSAAGLGPE
jgi:hypothetical protein